MKKLVHGGANINAEDDDGNAALILASRWGHVEVVRYLVEHGADSSCLNMNELSVLMLLLMTTYIVKEKDIVPIVRLLLDHGAPPFISNKQDFVEHAIARDIDFNKVIDLVDEYAAKPRREPDSKWFISPDTV